MPDNHFGENKNEVVSQGWLERFEAESLSRPSLARFVAIDVVYNFAGDP
jgi:hypothetical protein